MGRAQSTWWKFCVIWTKICTCTVYMPKTGPRSLDILKCPLSLACGKPLMYSTTTILTELACSPKKTQKFLQHANPMVLVKKLYIILYIFLLLSTLCISASTLGSKLRIFRPVRDFAFYWLSLMFLHRVLSQFYLCLFLCPLGSFFWVGQVFCTLWEFHSSVLNTGNSKKLNKAKHIFCSGG